MPLPQVGDRVAILPAPPVETVRTGTCMFVGVTKFGEGVWVGVELDTEFKGKNSGVVQGERYFECAPEQGVFVRPELVEVLGSQSGPSGSEMALRQDLDILRAKLTAAEAQIEELQIEAEVAMEEKFALEDSIRQLQAAVALGNASSQATSLVLGLQSKVAQLEATVADQKEIIADLKVQLDVNTGGQSDDLLETLTEQKLELEEQIASLESKLNRLSDERDELSQLSELQDEEIAELKALEAAATRQLEAALQAQRKLDDEHATVVRQLHERIADLQRENADLRKQDVDESIRATAATLRSAREQTERRLQDLTTSCAAMQIKAREESLARGFGLAAAYGSDVAAVMAFGAKCANIAFSSKTLLELAAMIRSAPLEPPEQSVVIHGQIAVDLKREHATKRFELLSNAVILSRSAIRLASKDPDALSCASFIPLLARVSQHITASGAVNELNAKISDVTSAAPATPTLVLEPTLSAAESTVALLRETIAESLRTASHAGVEHLWVTSPAKARIGQLQNVLTDVSALLAQVRASGCFNRPFTSATNLDIEVILNGLFEWCGQCAAASERVHQLVMDCLSGITTVLREDEVLRAWESVAQPTSHGADALDVLSQLQSAVKRAWHEAERTDPAISGDVFAVAQSRAEASARRLATLQTESDANTTAVAGVNNAAPSGPSAAEADLMHRLQASELTVAKLQLQASRLADVYGEVDELKRAKLDLEARIATTTVQYDEYIQELENEGRLSKKQIAELKANLQAAKRSESLGITEAERSRYEALIASRVIQREVCATGLAARQAAWTKASTATAALLSDALARVDKCRIQLPAPRS